MNERSETIPVTEDEIREHYGNITRAAVTEDGSGIFEAVEAYVRLRESRMGDPRIARIEALLDDDSLGEHLYPEDIRAILRGDA